MENGHGDGVYAPISMGHSVWMPDRFRLTFDDEERPLVTILDYVADDLGVRVTEVRQVPRVGAVLSPDEFRVPIGRLTETAITALALRGPERVSGGRLEDYERLDALPPGGPTIGRMLTRRRRRVLTPDLLTEVANVYADAKERQVPVRRAVAERWLVPENTARNWIGAARRAGLLESRHAGA